MRQGTSARRDEAASSVARAREQVAAQASAYTLKVLVRSSGPLVDEVTKTYVRRRIGLRLGKFAEHVDRISVRVTDVNGPRAGEDIVCQIKIVFVGLDSVVYECRGFTVREAVDRGVDRVEHLVARQLERAREHHAAPASSSRRTTARAAPSPAIESEGSARGGEEAPSPEASAVVEATSRAHPTQ